MKTTLLILVGGVAVYFVLSQMKKSALAEAVTACGGPMIFEIDYPTSGPGCPAYNAANAKWEWLPVVNIGGLIG